MLCQFSVRNYKSIRDEMTFDMQAASISEHTDRIIIDRDGQQFLPISAIYGPNGGGKSNILESLLMLHAAVVRPINAAKVQTNIENRSTGFRVKPFAFSEKTKTEPTEFEVFFRTDIAEYRYILHIADDKIEYESLDRIKFETERRSGLFVRDKSGYWLKGDFSKLRISKDLSTSLPLLSYLGITYMENEIVHDVLSWFTESIQFLNYGDPHLELLAAVDESVSLKRYILAMIHEMDLDIEDFRTKILDQQHIEVYTRHIVDHYEAELRLDEESSGTRKLFGLLPYIIRSILHGNTLVIDELDAKIHPSLLRYFLMMFSDMTINRKGAQLIITSHDLSTMNNEVFRRDEIWFVAKGKEQNSKLYSLVEFKNENGDSVRKDAKYDKQYLEGKYGADPYLRKIINWGEIDA